MLKLTRLNNHTVAINPDHISWVETNPDTTLCLINGEKLIVRESLDELIEAVLAYRRAVRGADASRGALGAVEGDPPRPSRLPMRPPETDYVPPRASSMPPRYRGGR